MHDQDYPLYKALNVTAETSPAMFFDHPVTKASGGLMDRNFSKMIAAGAHVTIGSDWGAFDLALFPCVAGIMQTVGAGDKALGSERLCRMMILASAQKVGREKVSGSVEVGKKGNFDVVDKDLSTGEFDDASVQTTWLEGEIVYEKNGQAVVRNDASIRAV